MTEERGAIKGWIPVAGVAIALIVLAVIPVSGGTLGGEFFASLRIARPAAVTATIPSAAGANGNRRLQDMIGGMLSDKMTVSLEESDQTATSARAASDAAGFSAHLPAARTDAPTFVVAGAHAITLKVNRDQLKTVLMEAGQPDAAVPATLDGATVTIRTARTIRAQYGNCPAPVANTLQNQINGPPPPTTDNGNCVILTEGPAVTADIPVGLDIDGMVDIALQLSGMSPTQTKAFQQTFDWKSTLGLSMPRSMRSYDSVTVNGARAMLVNTAGRRGPAYALIWSKGGLVYSLVGYGSSADAVPLAKSIP